MPCMRICRSASEATSRAILTMSQKKTRIFLSRIELLVLLGNALPDLDRVGVRRLHEDRPAGHQALQRARGLRMAVGSLMHSRSTCSSSQCMHDVRVGDGQVVGGRQALLLRAVLGIGLHVLAEDVAGDGGDDLVGRDRAEAADRVAAHREAARRPQVGVLRPLAGPAAWSMPTQKKSWPSFDHVVEGGDDVAGPHVAAAQAGRAAVNARHAVDLLLAVLAGHRVAEGRLDLARQVVAGRRERIVHPLEHRERLAVLAGPRRSAGPGTGRKTNTVRQPAAMPFARAGNRPSPWPSPCSSPCRRGCTRRPRSGTARRSRTAAGLAVELLEGLFQGRLDAVVVPALGDLALHVRVLVLHHARHQRVGRVHQVDQLFLRDRRCTPS